LSGEQRKLCEKLVGSLVSADMDGISCGRRLLSARFNVHTTGDPRRRQSLAVLPGNPMLSLGRPEKRWEGNIKTDLNRGNSVGTDLIQF
jgi:hypothetical protein